LETKGGKFVGQRKGGEMFTKRLLQGMFPNVVFTENNKKQGGFLWETERKVLKEEKTKTIP